MGAVRPDYRNSPRLVVKRGRHLAGREIRVRPRLTVSVVLAVLTAMIAAAASAFTLTDFTPLFSDADLGGTPGSLSLDGATLVAGSSGQIHLPAEETGLVTVFSNAGGWVETATLMPPAEVNGFGTAVDTDGEVIVAAASATFISGSVHVYRVSTDWGFEQTITNPDAGQFGHSVKIGNDLIAIGAPHWASSLGFVVDPAVYLYEYVGGLWSPAGSLIASSSCGPASQFGYDIDLTGNVLVIGSPGDALGICDFSSTTAEGSMSVWLESSGSWNEVAVRLRPSDPGLGDQFGASVAASGPAILVGAPGDDDLGTDSGSAYIFELVGGTWTQTAKLIADAGEDFDRFGESVAIADTAHGLRAVVGGSATRAVYVFERTQAGIWTETKVEMEALGYSDVGVFGTSVAADASLVAIGGIAMDPQAFVIDSAVTVPEPVDDSYTIDEDTILSAVAGAISPDPAGVLDNDLDPGGQGLTAALVAGTGNGTLNLFANGGFNYQPGPGFAGTDSFVYEACDPEGLCSQATATIQVESGPPSSAGNFITRSGSNLLLEGEEFTFTGINVYNANSDGTCGASLDMQQAIDEIGPGSQVIRAWFFQDLATDAGVRNWARFDNTLAIAEANGVKVIPVLANQWADCEQGLGFKDRAWYQDGYETEVDPDGLVAYRDWVEEIVTRYQGNSTVAFWQLINEAEIQDVQNGDCDTVTDPALTLRSWADDVSTLVKSIDSNHLVSLGTIGGGQCGTQEDEYEFVHDLPNIDLCEYHDYTPNEPLPGDEFNGLLVRLDQCDSLDKPLFVGEAGIKPDDVGGTLDDRAEAFAAKLAAQFDAGIKGFLAWAYTGGPSTVDDYDIGTGDPTLDVLAGFFNQPPSIEPIADVEVNEGQTVIVAISVSDPDGDEVVLTTDGLPAFATFDQVSAEITLAPGFDDAGTYGPISVSASDGNGGSHTITFEITVTEVNRDPLIPPIDDFAVAVGETATVTVVSADPDGDPVTLNPVGLPPFATFNAATAAITITPGSADVGSYPVTVNATDGRGGSASGSFLITVPSPVELRIFDTQALEGSPLVFRVSLSAPLPTALLVDYSTANGTAVSPADFSGGNGTVSIPAGALTQTFSIATVNDRLLEPVETFTLVIAAVGVTVVDASGVGRILPDLDICTIVGTDGEDTLIGDAGANVICGGAGNDVLDGMGGNDILFGEAGNDVLRGGRGNDLFIGGVGVDRASFALAPAAVNVRLDLGMAQGEGNDLLVSIEDVFGSEFADTIRGGGGVNHLSGNGGNDTMYGLGGADEMIGGAGNDRMFGGDGNDTMLGSTGNDLLEGENGNDTLSGNEGNDTLNGGFGNDSLSGGDDADHLGGGAGNDTLVGGPSPTPATVDNLDGGSGQRDTCFDGPGLPDLKVRCEFT